MKFFHFAKILLAVCCLVPTEIASQTGTALDWIVVEGEPPKIIFLAPGMSREAAVRRHTRNARAGSEAEWACWRNFNHPHPNACITRQDNASGFSYLRTTDIPRTFGKRSFESAVWKRVSDVSSADSPIGKMNYLRFEIEAPIRKQCFMFLKMYDANSGILGGWYCAGANVKLERPFIKKIISGVGIKGRAEPKREINFDKDETPTTIAVSSIDESKRKQEQHNWSGEIVATDDDCNFNSIKVRASSGFNRFKIFSNDAAGSRVLSGAISDKSEIELETVWHLNIEGQPMGGDAAIVGKFNDNTFQGQLSLVVSPIALSSSSSHISDIYCSANISLRKIKVATSPKGSVAETTTKTVKKNKPDKIESRSVRSEREATSEVTRLAEIERKRKETEALKVAAKVKHEDAIAVIIGNRDYEGSTPDVDFAGNDADAMKLYILNKLGYRPGNILDLRDASQADLRAMFGTERSHRGRLYDYVRANESDVIVFYSGHGVPDPAGKTGYLLPVDADPNRAEFTGYPVDVLLKNLAKVPAKSMMVFIDACFSGDSPKGMLVRATSGLTVKITAPKKASDNMIVITAAEGDQFASWDEDAKHGLFTKHLLEALNGAADKNAKTGNKDGKVTLGEVKAYLDREMTYQARKRFSRDQHATVSGDLKTVLSAY